MNKLLLLHGALGTKKQFTPIKKILAKKFEIYDFDFDGHGGTELNEGFSIELFSENVSQFLLENKIEKINIFGYSMGGYVALHAAVRNVEKIERIVTLGTKFNWDEESTNQQVKMLNPDIIEAKVPHYAAKLREDHAPQDWKEVMKKTANMMIELSKGKQLQENDLRKIKNRVMIGVGQEDKMVTYEESEKASKLIPNGSISLIPGFPHPLEKIDSMQLARYIEESFS